MTRIPTHHATRRGALRTAITAVLAAVLLSACFTTTSDFKDNAEEFIAEQVAPQLGTTFESVSCVAPTDQDVGTRFTCSALDADGGVWEFDNVIDSSNEFTVTVSRRP